MQSVVRCIAIGDPSTLLIISLLQVVRNQLFDLHLHTFACKSVIIKKKILQLTN